MPMPAAMNTAPQTGAAADAQDATISTQLFAALLAEAKGLSPDSPRSLNKVTRTV